MQFINWNCNLYLAKLAKNHYKFHNIREISLQDFFSLLSLLAGKASNKGFPALQQGLCSFIFHGKKHTFLVKDYTVLDKEYTDLDKEYKISHDKKMQEIFASKKRLAIFANRNRLKTRYESLCEQYILVAQLTVKTVVRGGTYI